MLVGLRKDLAEALSNKEWDDANKIQDLINKRVAETKPLPPAITARVDELRPPQPQVLPQVPQTPGSHTTIIVPQESSPKPLQVERIPRYGATDVARAMSLLSGQGGRFTDKEAGALSLLDMLMKRSII